MPKKFFNQNRRINTAQGDKIENPKNNLNKASLQIFDFQIKELWLENGKKLLKLSQVQK